jgi:hypothetical protein
MFIGFVRFFIFVSLGVAIVLSVLIVVSVTSSNDYQKEKQFQSLQAKQVR